MKKRAGGVFAQQHRRFVPARVAQFAPGQAVQRVATRQGVRWCLGKRGGKAFSQFPGGPACKGDRQNALRINACFHKLLQPPYQHTGFACAGSCQHKNRHRASGKGLLLFG